MTLHGRWMVFLILASVSGCGQGPMDSRSAPGDGEFMSAPEHLGLPPRESEEPSDGSLEPPAGGHVAPPGSASMPPRIPTVPRSSEPATSPLMVPLETGTESRTPPQPPVNTGAAPTADPLGSGKSPVVVPAPPDVSTVVEQPIGSSEDYVLEKVYYGTDRAPETTSSARWSMYVTAVRRFQVLLVAALTLCGLAFFVSRRRWLVVAPAICCLLVSSWFGRRAMLEYQLADRDETSENRRYGNSIHFVDGRHVLERGYCWVSVPVRVHERGSGELEEPGLFELRARPEKHFILQRIEQADHESFVRVLKEDVQKSGSKHAFVFIHGYNVLFREAALRTAQLRYDLDFDGPAAFFSWPSNGSLLSYPSDEETVNLTERSGVLHEFLSDFISETGAESIHLIAHSMGNRLLTRAFEKLPDLRNSQGQQMINRLIMAAPDVNPAEFMLLADRIRKLTRSRTLYASDRDIALIGSEALRLSNYTRLGQGGASRVIVDGVQTIDASDLGREIFDLGHSYYVHPQVMQDLKHLLSQRDVALTRPWLTPVGNYWTFRSP